MVKIDGTYRKCEWVKKSLTLTADIMNGENSGRLQNSYDMYLDYAGTFFNYKGQLRRTKDCTDEQFYEIFKLLANPINKHTIEFPFGTRTLTQQVYISKLEWTLIDKPNETTSSGGTVNHGYNWEKVIEVQFVAIKSMWKAGGSLGGLG